MYMTVDHIERLVAAKHKTIPYCVGVKGVYTSHAYVNVHLEMEAVTSNTYQALTHLVLGEPMHYFAAVPSAVNDDTFRVSPGNILLQATFNRPVMMED